MDLPMKRSLALSGAIHALILLAFFAIAAPRVEVSAPRVIQVLLLESAAGRGAAAGKGRAVGAAVKSARPESPPRREAAKEPPARPPRPFVRADARRARSAAKPAARVAAINLAAQSRLISARRQVIARRDPFAEEAVIGVSVLRAPVAPPGVAAGDGSQGVSSAVGAGSGGSGSGAQDETDRDHRIAIIRQRIQEALVYPRAARRRGIEGTSHVQFDLTGAGRLRTFALVRSSGKKLLDDASLRTVERAQPFPFVDGTLVVAIVFRLSGVD